MAKKDATPVPEVMLIEDAAKYLRSTVAKMYVLTRTSTRVMQKHPIPFVRFGKELRFRKSDLDGWMSRLAAESIAA
jgi:excisionase family DNA binding protein